MHLQPDLREFIALLNSHNVRYVLVGGYAVAHHGYPRFTGDIDFFVDISGNNPSGIIAVLRAFGFTDDALEEKTFGDENQIIQLGLPPNRIDLLTSISGVTFQEAWATREQAEIDGLIVHVISRDLLIQNKRAAARLKDAADLDNL